MWGRLGSYNLHHKLSCYEREILSVIDKTYLTDSDVRIVGVSRTSYRTEGAYRPAKI